MASSNQKSFGSSNADDNSSLDSRDFLRKRKDVATKSMFWLQKSKEHEEKQRINPFSDQWDGTGCRISKDDPRYGRPVEGSLTEHRGQQAGENVSKEIIELCQVITNLGHRLEPCAHYVITFGQLFDAYVTISNKLVGMLMRARKQGLVTFEGEMLWQRRDDHVTITLLKPVDSLTSLDSY